jgi:starvation-inducible DNA-binding protein
MEKLYKLLSDTQASLFVLFHKTWIYHWNVTGPNFKEYHDLFGTHYEEMFEEIDRLTEHMRYLGMRPVSTLSRITEVSSVEQASNSNQIITSKSMVEELMKDHQKMIEMLGEVSDEAEKQSSKGTINLVDDLNEAHGKRVWMLRSFIQ